MPGLSYSPVVTVPSPEEVAGAAVHLRCSIEQAAERLLGDRERKIARMRDDPIRCGFVPDVWRLCWALMGVSWVDPVWAAAVRAKLGFERLVRTLLVLGGNRAAKTQFEVVSGMREMLHRGGARFWMFHMTHQESVDYHQNLVWQHIPQGWRRKVKTDHAYLSWSEQMGFSNDKFILDNGSNGSFRNYSQNMRDAVEGGEPNAVCADELIPGEWVETLEFRLATRNGWMVIGFTPVDGYSPTVQMFCDGATRVLEQPAFLLPLDGGEPDEARALGLSEEDYSEVQAALDENRQPRVVPCRSVDLDAWLAGGSWAPPVPAGRRFESMPRVLKASGDRAVVFFWSCDNPYGGAANVIRKIRNARPSDKRIRFYGFAEKTVGARFHTFDERVHVVKAASIPREGTNYQIVDPCSGRAFFMLWLRCTPDGKTFVTREWPGSYYIPGVGVPEAWAETSLGREMDGRKGRGQASPGWGLCGYKREVARLEGWRAPGVDGRKGELLAGMAAPDGMGEEAWVASWDQRGPADEEVFERYMDARFGNTRGFDEGGMVTLIEKFDEVGLTFLDSSTGGGKWTVEDGSVMVEDALAWDSSREMSFFNEPRLYVSDECRNLIFALKVWTGQDGQKGATKDPIDCLRMGFLKGIGFVKWNRAEGGGVVGGGCY